MVYIEGKQLIQVAQKQSGNGGQQLDKPSNEELFDCIINKEEVSKFIKIPSRMFKGPRGAELAAITI